MDDKKLIEKYESGERNFRGANLVYANFSDANLRGAVLREADLSCANLCRANFGYANLRRADLGCANLGCANLEGANLRSANLSGANLSEANLSIADLSYANLSYANLSGAKLEGANLSGANLNRTKFVDANLRGTVLDSENEFDSLSEEEFLRAGFEVEVGRVIGYRTKRSTICGNTIYVPGETYTAPVFSTDADTTCHPGIYLAPLKWMKNEYPRWSLVKVSAAIPDVLKCGTKWRAREIFVIEDYEEKNGQKDTN